MYGSGRYVQCGFYVINFYNVKLFFCTFTKSKLINDTQDALAFTIGLCSDSGLLSLP